MSRSIFIQISSAVMDSSTIIDSVVVDRDRYCLFSTHFLTGDGGFIQAVMMGYAGLRFDEKGLFFHPQPGLITPATKAIRLRNLMVRGVCPVDYTIDVSSIDFRVNAHDANRLCVSDDRMRRWIIMDEPLYLRFDEVTLPVRLDFCNLNDY
jgi:hypothetical protein